MAEYLRDSCVNRTNKTRRSYKGNPLDPFRVSFYDVDKLRINDVTRSEAECIAARSPETMFYYQDGNGYQREIGIQEVRELTILDQLPTPAPCPTNPQLCGPPRVQFFGGGGGIGAMANAIISPNSKSVIGFDIINPGFNFLTPPFAQLIDECGNGAGGNLRVRMNGDKIKNILIDAPGDGYLPAPDGSLGGNGRVWKEAAEGYVETGDGNYYVVPSGQVPPDLPPGDKFVEPQPIPEGAVITYPVILEIEEVVVDDGGFGYEPGDTITVDNGAQLEPVINDRGEIVEVKVIKPGIGFVDTPNIVINSPRGYNAVLIPILKATPLEEVKESGVVLPPDVQFVSVVDCVGRVIK